MVVLHSCVLFESGEDGHPKTETNFYLRYVTTFGERMILCLGSLGTIRLSTPRLNDDHCSGKTIGRRGLHGDETNRISE